MNTLWETPCGETHDKSQEKPVTSDSMLTLYNSKLDFDTFKVGFEHLVNLMGKTGDIAIENASEHQQKH